MKHLSGSDLYIALIHFPVINKHGETIASAVTNLDLHDMSRSARTYGIKAFYVVTPLEDQQALVRKITGHWTRGFGADYNPKRRDALALIRVTDSLPRALEDITSSCGKPPRVVVTGARQRHGERPVRLDYPRFRQMLASGGAPFLLVFGTAWGLAGECVDTADFALDPIRGVGAYNHLSVRSATAIILDRIVGRDQD